jgi:predicted nucleotidyltransferase
MATAGKISAEEMAGYRAGARLRHEQEQKALAAREERAWELARQAAELLREQFHVSRVVVFGSLIHPGRFTPWSDVDIAAWGLRTDNWLKAIGAVMDLDSDIALNLVDVSMCKAHILEVIEREGVPV